MKPNLFPELTALLALAVVGLATLLVGAVALVWWAVHNSGLVP